MHCRLWEPATLPPQQVEALSIDDYSIQPAETLVTFPPPAPVEALPMPPLGFLVDLRSLSLPRDFAAVFFAGFMLFRCC